MSRFYGNVGFMVNTQTAPGVWSTEHIEHHPYFGDVTENRMQIDSGSNVNSSPNINLTIAIVGDDFAFSNIENMRYVEYMGSNWSIRSATPKGVKIILVTGGVYNGG